MDLTVASILPLLEDTLVWRCVLNPPPLREITKLLGCKLRPFFRLEYVRHTCATEQLSDHLYKMMGCGVVSHRDDVRPVGVAVYQDQVVWTGMRAEVTSYFLVWPSWFWFENDWLFGVGWEVVLALFAG